jgi:hypothetical protein
LPSLSPSQVNIPFAAFSCLANDTSVFFNAGVNDTGRWGAPRQPDCYPHGFLTKQNKCQCWDPTIYKGEECKESCVQFCSGRGVCATNSTTKCECWDPVRWRGDRCEVSVCGPHGIVVGGDWTAGALRWHLITVSLPSPPGCLSLFVFLFRFL